MRTPAEQLLQKMGEDKTFAETILKQSEIENIIQLVKEEGIELTREDIDEANAIIHKAAEISRNNNDELTDKELENVAGGITTKLTVLPTLSIAIEVV